MLSASLYAQTELDLCCLSTSGGEINLPAWFSLHITGGQGNFLVVLRLLLISTLKKEVFKMLLMSLSDRYLWLFSYKMVNDASVK